MASYTTVQKEFVIKTFYSSGGYCIAMERQHCREFSVRGVSRRDNIYGLLHNMQKQ
jgi:hypothetical protein